MSDFALRPEAGPVPYGSLIECQKDAFKKILAALDEARRQLAAKSEVHRVSRIFFVSGEPGSGKSSLYFTLREILSSKTTQFVLNEKHKGTSKNNPLVDKAGMSVPVASCR